MSTVDRERLTEKEQFSYRLIDLGVAPLYRKQDGTPVFSDKVYKLYFEASQVIQSTDPARVYQAMHRGVGEAIETSCLWYLMPKRGLAENRAVLMLVSYDMDEEVIVKVPDNGMDFMKLRDVVTNAFYRVHAKFIQEGLPVPLAPVRRRDIPEDASINSIVLDDEYLFKIIMHNHNVEDTDPRRVMGLDSLH